MSKVSFIDSTGEPIYGVIALMGGTPVAADTDNGYLKLDDGSYVFKLMGFHDLPYDVTGNVELVLEEKNYEAAQVSISAFYQHKTWILALFVLLVGWSISKIRE